MSTRAPAPKRDLATLLRFIAVGAFNSLSSLVVYWLLLPHMPPQPAYALCFVVGILISWRLNTGVVFRARRTWLRFFAFPLVYGIGYLVGAGVLALSVRHFGVPEALGPVVSLCATWPVMFLLMRQLLRPDADAPPEGGAPDAAAARTRQADDP